MMRTCRVTKAGLARWVATAALGFAGCVGVVGDAGHRPGGGSAGTTGTAAPVAFAPSPGAYKRLTATSFRNSLNDLLGPVTAGDLEPDSWEIGGLATVGMSQLSISELGVEQYQTAIDAATTQLFADPARRDKVLGCTPRNAQDTACAQQFVTQFGRLAFRQSLTQAQIDRYTQLATTVTTTLGDVYEGLRAAMSGLLLSPYFLYRLERGSPSAGGGKFWQYTSNEMASRLAYFLTNSTPDTTLLALADQDGLRSAAAIRAQADRLLATPKGRQSVGNFAAELFQLDIIGSRAKDPNLFPQYTAGLQAGMIQEIPAMFEALVLDQRISALSLFTTRNTFVNKDLAALYGLPTAGMTSQAMTAVALPGDGLRAGLFGTSGFLSLYASQKEGSPTQRGKFIREIVLCQDIPPPPPDVNTMLTEPPPGVVLTKRQKLQQHETVKSCAGCHAVMDPLGLALENFDAIGQYRTTDQGLTIDASGDLDGTAFHGPIELGQLLAKNPDAASCMVRSIYRYGTGHVETPTEAAVLDDLGQRFKASGYQLRDLMVDLVSSDGFRFVAAPAP
jgi:hypothetical protein